MNREKILAAMSKTEWAFALNDQAGAIKQMAERIARQGRLQALITYSNLVSGITFQFSNVNGGKSFVIDTHNWQGLDRRILGDSLGYLSYLSYRDHDFMASAVVAGLPAGRPSTFFFEWMVSLKALSNTSEKAIDEFWVKEVIKAHAWYKVNPKGFPVHV